MNQALYDFVDNLARRLPFYETALGLHGSPLPIFLPFVAAAAFIVTAAIFAGFRRRRMIGMGRRAAAYLDERRQKGEISEEELMEIRAMLERG